jgi:hypothetical protein
MIPRPSVARARSTSSFPFDVLVFTPSSGLRRRSQRSSGRDPGHDSRHPIFGSSSSYVRRRADRANALEPLRTGHYGYARSARSFHATPPLLVSCLQRSDSFIVGLSTNQGHTSHLLLVSCAMHPLSRVFPDIAVQRTDVFPYLVPLRPIRTTPIPQTLSLEPEQQARFHGPGP